ncbi:GM12674 [Drosophila sechellia]|uniref:GM12674 n=1 Tax=Drosophila sechellia TaxID=7238 RepID=B4I0W7_DROSE|nr:GM12674 [Drosophila sechellia]
MRNLCWLLAVPIAILPLGCAIVGAGRDLLLTPRQGHQLSGKRIFYEEPAEERVLNQRRSQSARPWERTLKHVTYVTLFTDAAMGAAAGNLSQLHEYHDFLQTPYAPADDQRGGAATGGAPSARFGDIMTLAKGYLEQLPGPGNASSYRFVEGGTCYQLNCPNSNPKQRRALWQVQRIRHRDGDKGRHYHYEMKFSVTPLDHKAWQPHHQQMSYIQKESDYPASFGRLAHDQGFAQRRQDRERYGAAAGGSGGNAEQSQATFVHGIFQTAPPPKLNIGEYLKGAVAQGGPKIELFPGLLNLGLRPNYVVPTTFRPSYPAALKFGTHPELERFPTHNGELGNAGNAGPAVTADLAGISGAVTHHFHHHFYVAPGAGDAQLHPELGYRLPNSSPPEPITPASNLYTHHQTVQFPSSNSGSSESLEEQEQDLLLRTPQIYGQASKYQTAKLPPLLIYAGGSSGDEDKSFVRSEPLEETVYRYSEPDPLYVHQNPIDVLQDKQPPEEETERGQHQELATPSPSAGTTTETASTERSTHVIPTTSASFVSTSTHFSPLRTISRYRTTPKITAGRSTTTTTSTSTEPPLNKWAKRRKEQDTKAKSSHRHEAFVSTTSSTSTTSTTTSTTPPPPSTTAPSTRVPLAPPLPPAPPSKEVVEVLTQKSVSRSVSMKVGENGEEIPIIVDDEENEVKPVLTN